MNNKKDFNKEINGKILNYNKNYICGNFNECSIIMQDIFNELVKILELHIGPCIDEKILETLVTCFEKKDWVYINDILIYEILPELNSFDEI